MIVSDIGNKPKKGILLKGEVPQVLRMFSLGYRPYIE